MPTHYTIGGCQVQFPHQAYGVQLSFMSKVIAALEGGHNALLEAPTGSGKTLSLLCSALAWQVREKQRIEEGLAAERAAAAAAKAAGGDGIEDADGCPGSGGGGAGAPGPLDDPFAQPPHSASPSTLGDGGFMADGGEGEAPPPRRKPPKIFYATRTHSQIQQVVKELKRSEYKPRMTVLGSRKHYCVNMHATKQSSIDEACEELLKESQCQYFKNVHSFVNGGHQYRLHDIEDLKALGRSHKVCPYYTARKWAEEAEVIFAPYSYLLDPVIRRAMAVDVEGGLLIFDEAHNIEDVCREAASTEVDLGTMREVLSSFKKAYELNGKPEVYGPLASCADAIIRWMMDKERVAIAAMAQQRAAGGGGRGGGGRGGGGGVGRYQDPYEKLIPQNQMLRELEACGLGADQVDPLWEAYQAAREEEEAMGQAESGGAGGQRGKENQPNAGGGMSSAMRVGALSLGIMSRLIQVVRMLHQVSTDGPRDYRMVVQRLYEREPQLAMGRYRRRAESEDGGGGEDTFLPGFCFKMCLWSMNPAVAFKLVADAAHSVVLTSGTLAPLEGFASELGTPFSITLEAPHVVDMRRQVWAGVVGTGPGGTPLNATWRNQNEPAFQDAIGRVVLEGAQAIPDGLLVFMPSYSLLDRLMQRWKSTGLLKQLGELKKIVQEPRGGGQDGLKKVMQDYYKAIESGGGGIFFAVCRGKVSEGLDFADGNARGVIIVGIPFPHAKDLKVNEKKGFNDRGQKALGLVSGDTWYSQQAFRALNQALGRCIRHRLDWGAILMVDDRFKQPRNQRMLSRWVRGALAVHPSFEAGMHSMRDFFETLKANPPGPAPAAKGDAAPAANVPEAEMAAAVAAAIAAAGPLPQPKQEAEPVPAGRGAEGALGAWGASLQPRNHPVLAMFDMWQNKPLAQARHGAAGGGGGLVKEEPGEHLQIKQEQPQQPPPMQHQQQQQPQQPQQPPPMQQQQQQRQQAVVQQLHFSSDGGPPAYAQQLHFSPDAGPHAYRQQLPGYYSRPPSASAVGTPPAGALVALQAAVATAPIAAWAVHDVADCLAFLREQGMEVLPDGYASLMQLAVAGVKDAFDAASEFLGRQQPLHHLAAEWACALPRGLQACLAAGPAAFPQNKPADPAARAFGEQRLRSGWGVQQLVQAVAAAYEAPLVGLEQLAAGPSSEDQLQQLLVGEAALTAFAPQHAASPAAPCTGSGTPGGAAHPPLQEQDQQHAVTPVMHWGADSSGTGHGAHSAQQQQQQQLQQQGQQEQQEQQRQQQALQPVGQAGPAPSGGPQLTAGAAVRLYEGAGPGGGPLCVQVIGIKPLRSQAGGRQLVRLLLSDGTHSHPCLLASQLSAMVVGGGLRQGAIVRLQDWEANFVQGKKVVIVLSLQVLQPEAPPIGDPQLYEKVAAGQLGDAGPAYGAAAQGGQALPPSMQPAQQHHHGLPPHGMQQQSGLPMQQPPQQQGPAMQQQYSAAPPHYQQQELFGQQHGGWAHPHQQCGPSHSHQWHQQRQGPAQRVHQYGGPQVQPPHMQLQPPPQQQLQHGALPPNQQQQGQLPHQQQPQPGQPPNEQQLQPQPHWAANHRYPPVAPQPLPAAQQPEQQQGGKRPGGRADQAANPAKKRYLRGGNAEAAARSRAAAAAAGAGGSGLDEAQRAAIAHEVAADSNSDDDFK